jgi:two-component system, NtrC family, response regulator AtoC
MVILYVDDIDDERELASNILKDRSYHVIDTNNPEIALNIIKEQHVDLVISDFRMPNINGVELLKKVKSINPLIHFILVTQYGDTELAVNVIKKGAAEFLDKPIDFKRLINMVQKIEKEIREDQELEKVDQITSDIDKYTRNKIIYKSNKMKTLLSHIPRFADTDYSILIMGESGTGKELIADLIQTLSKRKDDPYIKINSAAIPANLMESELFGHVKGAFTGAVSNKMGKIESANKGTVFLDEIAEMPKNMQSKLLRLLEHQEIQRVGETKTETVDIRIISATNKNLEEQVEQGKFREDLYYRLNGLHIEIPPLRNRKEDIIPLAEYFIRQNSTQNDGSEVVLSTKARHKLVSYDYPGNIRELKNIVLYAMVLTYTNVIDEDSIVFKKKKSITKPMEKSEDYDNHRDISTDFLTNLYKLTKKKIKTSSFFEDDTLSIISGKHYKISNGKLILYTTKCLDILEKAGYHYDRNILLKNLREKKYLISNEGLAYFDGVRKRAWELDLNNIKEKVYVFY